jgi:hypothetical protein
MGKKRRITTAERNHINYLRRKGLQVGHVYEQKLLKARREEVRRVLKMCRDYSDPSMWPEVIDSMLDESGYFYDWMKGLYLNAGLPRAKSITRDLSRSKAEDPSGMWEQELVRYATGRAGENIVSVSGSLKDELNKILQQHLLDTDGVIGVERLTQEVFRDYGKIAEWMVRRIAQTETMIGMAEAGAIAADSLDVGFTKQWCIAGIRTRESHLVLDGVEIDQDDLFNVGTSMMRWPHDSSFGADAGEIINCACDVIRRPK